MKRIFISLLMMTSLFGGMIAASPTASAACNTKLLSIPAWYDGLTKGNDCELKSPTEVGGIEAYIWKIALNILNIILQLVAYISVGFIIFGGFLYLTSGGEQNRITSGRKIIMNAVIGLVLSFFSVAIVSLIAGNIG